MSIFKSNNVKQYNLINDKLPTTFFFSNTYTDTSNVKCTSKISDNMNPFIIGKMDNNIKLMIINIY